MHRRDAARPGAVALALGAALACAHNTSSPTSTLPRVWVQVWSDEFKGPAGGRVDSTKWRYDIGDGCQQGICGWGNNEKESYTDLRENIALNGQGQLMIAARHAPAALTCHYGPCRYARHGGAGWPIRVRPVVLPDCESRHRREL